MAINNGTKITSIMVSAANGDTYGDAERQLFRGIQTLVMPNVISMALSTPPLSPTFGQAYVVASSPSGAWAGQANNITAWAIDSQSGPPVTTGAWEFYAPQAGWVVFDQTTSAFWAWSGSAWVLYKSAPKSPSGIVTATSTTTLSPLSNSSFRINLNNVATVSLVINNGGYDGQEITVEFVQGGTVGSAVTFAANIHGAGFLVTGSSAFSAAPSTALNSVSVQRYTWDAGNTIWYALSTGVSGQ
jgi:hypothetical protein